MAADNPGRPHLERIPPEVLHLILGQFCQHCRGERTGSAPGVYFDRVAALDCPARTLETHWRDKADLRSLCLVSRALRAAAQPVLYHLYRPHPRGHDDAYARLFRFVGSLTDQPRHDLAASVRSLCVGHPDPYERWRLWHYALSSTAAALCLRDLLAMFPPGSRYEASEPPGLFSKADLIGGLLRLLPSLTELSLGNEALEPFEDYVPACLEQVDYLPLQKLEVSTNAGGLRTYIYLKKLSKLEGRIIEMSRDLRVLQLHLCDSLGLEAAASGGREGRQPTFSLPHLRSLRITESRLNADELRHLLSACPSDGALREFVFDAAEVYLQVLHNCTGESFRTPPEQWMRTRKPDVDPSAVIDALKHLRGTLESLHLNVHQFMDIPGKAPFAPLRSLAGFVALRNLLLDWRSICGGYARKTTDSDDTQRLVRLLPEGIRSLYIVGCAHEIHPQRLGRALEGLAAARDRGRFPDLKRVGCDIRRAWSFYETVGRTEEDSDGAGQNAAWKDMFGAAGGGGAQFEYDMDWEGGPSPGGRYFNDTGYREASFGGEDFGPLIMPEWDTEDEELFG
ncbi:hypothetical protein PG985_011225 [Apiospora marii]|uniref:F-box domain-containing protein n=1 Tax=Apiospora marii TaxID=335849 RepID=A0ABR1ST49_9PEZI